MGLVSTFFCLLAAIPGPPGLTLNGGWFQAVPVRRNAPPCDIIDPNNDIIFHLYQGSDASTHHTLVPGDEASLKLSGFDPKLPTVIYVHGFLDGPDSEEVEVVKQAYATRGGHNFIVVGWKRLAAGPWYFSARENITPVGKYIARLLDFLVENKGPLNSIHLVGHSLGAHISSVAASNTSTAKVSRITALDPALSFIDLTNLENTIDTSDAPFVDVIHTDGNSFGISKTVGHVDFYPNGGVAKQPGCGVFDTPPSLNFLQRVFCSHRRSYWLYAASVVNEQTFQATKCDSWSDYEADKCTESPQIPMGFLTPTSARGSFFLRVKDVPPF